MATLRQLTQRQQQLAYNTVQQNLAVDNYLNPQPVSTPSTWDAFTSDTNTEQKATAGNVATVDFPINILLSGKGTYSPADMKGNTNLGGNQDSGLPFGNYSVGSSPTKLEAENQNLLYGGNMSMAGLNNNQQNRQAATDLAIVKAGEELNFYASSPGSPSDNARMAGIKGASDFYRETNQYGAEVRVGGAGNPNAGVNFPAKTAFTGGPVPLDWNKDNAGRPLPWGTRREADGKVYSTSGGGDNWKGTSFFTGELPGSNLVSVLAVPTSNLKTLISYPVQHVGYSAPTKLRNYYNF